MERNYNPIYEEPAYGTAEAAAYLKVPYQTLRYWLTGFKRMPPMVIPAEKDPPRLSFLNLIECHVLASMRKLFNLKLPKVRSGLKKLAESDPNEHPLVHRAFLTDRKDLFVEEFGRIVNISQHGQLGMEFSRIHLERVEVSPNKMFRFFPFVQQPSASEPKMIEINPMIGFGKPVIAGTGISTAIIASRFNARESTSDLAAEYECSIQQIEEAIRWERPLPVAA
ncbi:MAG TPA: DUF433 domain-containing protein [Candidatus Acidoferrales bacterium]|nr:DUF433 domain-containing protein [Candidatus Acidoferrales bacterium]